MFKVRLYGYFRVECCKPCAEVELKDNEDVESLYYYIVRNIDYDCFSRDEIYELLQVESSSCLEMLEDLINKGFIYRYVISLDMRIKYKGG